MVGAGDRFFKLIKWLLVLVIIGVIALAVAPLNLYYDQVSKHIRPVSLNDISGSMVKGSAGELKYMSLPMGEAEWLLYPSSYDAVGGKVKLKDNHYDMTFQLGQVRAASALIKQVRGYLDWQVFAPFVQIRYGELSGYASIDLQDVVFEQDSGLQRISGEITLKDFKMLKPAPKDLGEIKLTFNTEKQGVIVGQFSSDSNVLAVSGTLYVQPRRWQLNVDLVPKAGHFELDAVLSSVGQARRGGGRRLNLAGFY